jgi:hypothetical protein
VNRRAWFAAIAGAGASASASAQTPTTGRPVPMVALFTPRGLSPSVVGAGLAVTQENGVYVLSAPGGVTHRRVECREGSFAVTGLVALFRNGMALTEGIDFDRTAAGAKLTRQGYDAEDVWSALCLR